MGGVNDDDLRGEQDIEKVRAAALELQRRNARLEAENAVLLGRITALTRELATATDKDRQLALGLEIRRINEQLAAKNRELFGSSRSERRVAAEKEKSEEEKPKAKGHGPTKQQRLPVTEVPHKREDAAAPCPACKQDQPEMAGQTEDSEQITIVERRVVLCVHKRHKYRCTTCGRIDTAPGPKPLVPGGRYSPESAVAVAVDKYADHLPLERQVDRFAWQGLDVTNQTLWDQLVALYPLLLPAQLKLHERLLAKHVVGADESPWRVMGKGRSARWWTWVLVGDDAVFYRLAPTRGKAAARELLVGFKGVVSVDGYPVYTSLEAEFGGQASLFAGEGNAEACGFILVACWMHARRGFIKAEKNHPAAKEVLDLIAKLYRVEDEAEKVAKANGEALFDARRRLRDTQSREIVRQIRVWLDAQRPIPRLQLDQALVYLRNQWPRLIRFLDDPRAPIDNGWAERAVRGTVLGRKNHYGSHSELGTRVAALFYSLIETCKLIEIDPVAYLNEAVRRALRNKDDVLTPHAWRDELLARAAAK
jgi:transposase